MTEAVCEGARAIEQTAIASSANLSLIHYKHIRVGTALTKRSTRSTISHIHDGI